ncbi:MAG: cadherin-like domain-containing protein [Phycisphaerae bacterium]|nr:cadherin-like domain-containing protein [Phycisphaerae bacterium]
MSGARWVAAIVGSCLVLPQGVLADSVDLSGHVYEGEAREVVGPLAGVTVSLYVSNDAMVLGERALSTTTDERGYYDLHLRDSGTSEYFHIVQTNLPDYTSVTSTTVGGTYVSADWIRYDLGQLMTGSTADNNFYDRSDNRPPTARDDIATTATDTPVDIPVLANDSDPDGDSLSIVGVTDPAHGAAVYKRQSVTYTPDAGYVGEDVFTYTVGDGRGGEDTAIVTVTVLAETLPMGEIRGTVFDDLNGDGWMDPDENGLAGWIVFLDDDGDGVPDGSDNTTWTNPQGDYVFSDLNPGAYRVGQVVEDGWRQVWPLDDMGEPTAWAVTVEPGQVARADFGNVETGSVPDDGQTGLELVAGPNVEHLSPHEVAIAWQTNVESTGVIRYGQNARLYPHQADDPLWAVGHHLILSGLTESTVYHFVLTCTGRSGDQLTTRDLLFETLSEQDDSPPSLTIEAPARPAGMAIISVQAEDDTGVDRVVFFVDDEPILIDYSPPYEAPIDTTQYDNGPHSVAATAHDQVGKHTAISQTVDIENLVEERGPNVRITSPKAGASVSGDIQIEADVTDDKGLWKAEFYVDGKLVQQEVFSGATPPTKAHVQFTLDTRQVSKEIANDPHDIAVQAWDTAYRDGADMVRLFISNVTAVPQYPWLKVIGHTVSRTGNQFTISLVVENQGTATAHDVVIQSGMTGFQAIAGSSAEGEWFGRYNPKGRFGYCEIHSNDISASAKRTFTYNAVPVLQYPSLPASQIGQFIYLDYGGPPPASQGYFSSDPWPVVQVTSPQGTQNLEQAHQAAVSVCDYLIVTNPYRLYAAFNPSFYQGATQATADVDSVLSLMAELALAKQGTLGYNDQYDVASLVQLVHVGGAWSSQLASGWASSGYLLIVGENEIVPAQAKKITYEYTGGTQVWDFVSDYRYASTSGDEQWPELSIGRIIGNSAGAIRTAIKTALGGKTFDRSHSLLVSGDPGTGDNTIDFKSWVNGALSALEKQYVAPLTAQTVLDQPPTAKLLAEMTDQDVIFLAGHGNPSGWNGVTTADIQGKANLFGTTSPFVFAHSCKTGRYAGTYCLAEAFLDAGAAVYLGATDSAGWQGYSDSFFQRWDLGKSVGQAVKETKQNIGDEIEDELWSQTYHVFGDPKFGAVGTPSAPGAGLKNVALCGADANEWTPVEVEIGDYEAREVDGRTYLTLPGGQILSIPDMPLVPYMTIRRSYPRDTQIQQVSLEGLSEPEGMTGVDLAQATNALPGGIGGPLTTSDGSTWWPDRLFKWDVHETPTEVVLALSVYPVRYNAQTHEIRFHRWFRFAVEATTGDVQITDMVADDIIAQPGDSVCVDFLLARDGTADDTVVQTVVLDSMTSEVVAGLPLRCLHALEGRASYACLWDTTDVPAGVYVLRAELRSLEGSLLDSSVRTVQLGLYDCQVSDLDATPQLASVGEVVTIDATVQNSGWLPLSGTGLLGIDDSSGLRVVTFTDEIGSLSPGEVLPVRHAWTAPAVGLYTLTYYVLYEGKATEPVSLPVEVNDE